MTKGAELIKLIRVRRGLTQMDVERHTGVPRGTVACLETNPTYTTSVNTAMKLARFFELDWKVFFEEGGDNVLLTVREVAEILKVNKNYVYNVIKRGELKSVNIGSIKVKKSDLEAFIDSKGI